MIELGANNNYKFQNQSPNMYYGENDLRHTNNSRSETNLFPNVYSPSPNIQILNQNNDSSSIAGYNKSSFYNRFLQNNKQI